jgi:hypothetical protein
VRDVVHEPDTARAKDAAVGDVDDIAAKILCPSATAVAQAGASFGAFSTSTRHIRQTPATGSDG